MKKHIQFLLILIISSLSFQSNCQTATTEIKKEYPDSVEIKKFWVWFKKNEKTFKEFQKNPDTVLTHILDAAMEINPGLAIELEPPVKGIINFTFSANGDPELLSVVHEIIKRAPKIKGWNFIELTQQLSLDIIKTKIIEIDKKKFDPNTLKFKSFEEGDKIELIIYGKGISSCNYNDISYKFLNLINQILGEYNCATKISQIEYMEMPKDKKLLAELKPLLELADYVELFYKVRK